MRKFAFNNNLVMLLTGAVWFIIPMTGKSTLAYAEHDAAVATSTTSTTSNK